MEGKNLFLIIISENFPDARTKLSWSSSKKIEPTWSVFGKDLSREFDAPCVGIGYCESEISILTTIRQKPLTI